MTKKNLPTSGKAMMDEIKTTLKKFGVWEENTSLHLSTPKLQVMMHNENCVQPCHWVDKFVFDPQQGKFVLTSVCECP